MNITQEGEEQFKWESFEEAKARKEFKEKQHESLIELMKPYQEQYNKASQSLQDLINQEKTKTKE